MNFVVAAFHVGNPPGVRVTLPKANEANPGVQSARYATLVSPEAWPGGLGPREHGDLVDLLRGLRARGVRQVEFGASADPVWFNRSGLTALATVAGLPRPPVYAPESLRAPHDAYVARVVPEPGGPKPCRTLGDGTGVYVTLGPPGGPLVCPR